MGTAGAAQARRSTRRVARSGWLERAVRLGYMGRGVLYGVVGVTALRVATGSGGETQDGRGALRTIAEEPFGTALLTLIGAGLAGYALWRLAQAVLGDGDGDTGWKMVAGRVYALARMVVYGILSYSAFRIAYGSSGGDGGSQQTLTGRVLEMTGGRWLVALAGCGILAYGIAQLRKAASAAFIDDLKTQSMDANTRTLVVRAGRAGYAGRGIVYGTVGALVVLAAYTHDESRVAGMDGALQTLADQPYGPWLLGVTALGLACFGMYSFAEAKYRRVDVG